MIGAAIAYSTKWHQTVFTSSIEAEFIQETYAAKIAKYIHAILKELKMEQDGPMMIYEDNATVIMMANASKQMEEQGISTLVTLQIKKG
eukprot:3172860-Ditylum_brightwellii.AAC.1